MNALIYTFYTLLHVEKGHSLTAALGYSDDTTLVCTSWASGYFAQIHYLMMKYEWGIEVGFKPGKTDPVSKEALWIGYLFSCIRMTVVGTGCIDPRQPIMMVAGVRLQYI